MNRLPALLILLLVAKRSMAAPPPGMSATEVPESVARSGWMLQNYSDVLDSVLPLPWIPPIEPASSKKWGMAARVVPAESDDPEIAFTLVRSDDGGVTAHVRMPRGATFYTQLLELSRASPSLAVDEALRHLEVRECDLDDRSLPELRKTAARLDKLEYRVAPSPITFYPAVEYELAAGSRGGFGRNAIRLRWDGPGGKPARRFSRLDVWMEETRVLLTRACSQSPLDTSAKSRDESP